MFKCLSLFFTFTIASVDIYSTHHTNPHVWIHHMIARLPCLSMLLNHFSLSTDTMCCVMLCYLLRKRPENIQEQPCRQGNEKKGVITSEAASSDSSAVLLLFHPHAVSLSPSVFIQWSAAPACHAMKTAQKWLLWKLSPTGHLCHRNQSDNASCWLTLPEHLRLFWRQV